MARQWEMSPEQVVDARPATTVGALHLPLRQAVLDALRSAIIDGTYLPGERLVEEEIAARFDVSRNPTREALHALSVEGFVEIEPRRGARVATMNARRAGELFEVRAPLEGLVARLAAQRRTPADLVHLRDVLGAGTAAAAEGRLDELPALNTEFHMSLAAAAGNELLAGTLARLSDIIRWVYAARISMRSTRSWDEHAAIVAAVADRDAERAERRGAEHISAAAAAYED
ncbi:MAG: GntR family transcriptional regulator [Actinomycetota bacterium]|nr:GntR family transcriptional regulator [Actinomycetota bacterium]